MVTGLRLPPRRRPGGPETFFGLGTSACAGRGVPLPVPTPMATRVENEGCAGSVPVGRLPPRDDTGRSRLPTSILRPHRMTPGGRDSCRIVNELPTTVDTRVAGAPTGVA